MPICVVDDCGRTSMARKLCSKHYQRWQKHGNPTPPAPKLEDRLLSRRVIDGNGCWIWQGAKTPDGYGHVTYDKVQHYVHVAAHRLWVGPVPPGYEVDHVRTRGCMSTSCFNPAHLEAVTPEENRRRSNSPAAVNERKTHCPQGHPYDDANTYIRPSTECRSCRACTAVREDWKKTDEAWKVRQAAYRRELRARRKAERAA